LLEDDLIKRRRFWILALKIMLAANMVWQGASFVSVIVSINSGTEIGLVSDLLGDISFLLLRVFGYISTLIFVIAALLLYYQIKALIN